MERIMEEQKTYVNKAASLSSLSLNSFSKVSGAFSLISFLQVTNDFLFYYSFVYIVLILCLGKS